MSIAQQSSASGKKSNKASSSKGSARSLLGCIAGTSSALYDIDSDGYGLSSRENVKELVPDDVVDVESVQKGLQEKARLTAEFAGRLFQAMQVSHLLPRSWSLVSLVILICRHDARGASALPS